MHSFSEEHLHYKLLGVVLKKLLINFTIVVKIKLKERHKHCYKDMEVLCARKSAIIVQK